MTNGLRERVANMVANGQDLRPVAQSEADQLFEYLKTRLPVIQRLMMAHPDDDDDAVFTKLALNYVHLRILLTSPTGATQDEA